MAKRQPKPKRCARLTDVETLVLAKIVPGPEATLARKEVAVGCHDLDMTVQIKGTMRVGEDYPATPTVSIPAIEALALFATYSGITREAAMTALRTTLQDVLVGNGFKASGEIVKAKKEIAGMIERIKSEILEKLDKQTRKGPVTFQDVTVEAI